MKQNMMTIAIASVLLGGAALLTGCSAQGERGNEDLVATNQGTADDAANAAADEVLANEPVGPKLEYAEVVQAKAVTEKQRQYATVIGTDPVRETTTTSTPREVCEDTVVQERLPERDGNAGGTVVGAVIGGLVGNQVGSGSGRKAATAAGAVAGGIIGNKVDKKHERGQVVDRVETHCRTVQDSSESTKVVAYNVTYRNPDGTTGTMRVGSKPGERIALGSQDVTVGYDVTYRYDGVEQTIRMDRDPGDRLPVIDGEVVIQTASTGAPERG